MRTEVIQQLRTHGIIPKKKYGQNFLINEKVAADIIAASELSSEDAVIEIGAGIGNLTKRIAPLVHKVYAVEADRYLYEIAQKILSGYPNVKIIEADILKIDLDAIFKSSPETSFKIIGNLPYYITTPIIMRFLEGKYPFKLMVVTVQKEVAYRMTAKSGTKEYSALTLAVNYRTTPEIVRIVPRSAFYPAPDVESAIVKLKPYFSPPVKVIDETLFFQLIQSAFAQRRKIVLNALTALSDKLSMDKKQIQEILLQAGIDPHARGENLSLAQFANLSNLICNKMKFEVL